MRCAEDRTDASMWTVDTVVQNDSCQQTVSVQFQFGPTSFAFNVYTVMLVHRYNIMKRSAHQERLVRINEVCIIASLLLDYSTESLGSCPHLEV